MRGLFWLSDEQWTAIEPHLPYYAAGKRREDDRRIISGIIHVLQSESLSNTDNRSSPKNGRCSITIPP